MKDGPFGFEWVRPVSLGDFDLSTRHNFVLALQVPSEQQWTHWG